MDNKNKNVLVVGDVILDEYTHGKKLGVSAETPTVVAEFEKTESFVGGAGLVARHLLRLGCHVTLLTVGPDLPLRKLFLEGPGKITFDESQRLVCDVVSPAGWEFTQKKRFYVDDYKMVQYDVLNKGKYDDNLVQEVCRAYAAHSNVAQAVVICDNRHGVMEWELQDYVLERKERYGGKIFVDSQVSQNTSNHLIYSGATAFFVNEKELDSIIGLRGYENSIEKRAGLVSKRLGSDVIVKLGDKGSLAVINGVPVRNQAHLARAIDTCGAGDAFLAAYVAAEDLTFANRWAALSTTYKGTIVPTENQ